MGIELWKSPNTGIRRKGTSIKEIHDLFLENINTRHIYEPIQCCNEGEDAQHVLDLMKNRDFDVLGVINENEKVIGYVKGANVEKSKIIEINEFDLDNLISESTPFITLLEILARRGFSFVLSSNDVKGIVTIVTGNLQCTEIGN